MKYIGENRTLKTFMTSLILIFISLSVRSLVWISDLQLSKNLSVWDIDIYKGLSSVLLGDLSSGNLAAASTLIASNPPLGLLLIGLLTKLNSLFLPEPKDILFSPIILSSLTCLVVYQIGSVISRRVGLLAWALVTLDPYSVQFSVAFLDSVMLLFISLAMLLMIKEGLRSFRHLFAVALLLCLAVLSKFTAGVFVAVLTALTAITWRSVKKPLLLFTLVAAASIAVTFQPWNPEIIQLWLTSLSRQAQPGTPTFNTLRLPVFFGPIDIGVPLSYPWYILTYIGMGYVHWRTLPYITHLLLFAAIAYSLFRKRWNVDPRIALWAATSILTIFFLPRNYWTASWSEGFIQGTLSKQFYPYYFTITTPPSALLTSMLLLGNPHNTRTSVEGKPTKLIAIPILAFSSVAPLTFVMLLGFPYWDFIFTLIANYSKNPTFFDGLVALVVTVLVLAYTVAWTVMVSRNIRRTS
jgi:4-amino-4-deoxy-L-arabinose transferase-like glycosyltransferase